MENDMLASFLFFVGVAGAVCGTFYWVVTTFGED